MVSAGFVFRGKQYLADSGALVISSAKTQQLKGSFYLRMYDSNAPTQMIVLEGTFAVTRDPEDSFGR